MRIAIISGGTSRGWHAAKLHSAAQQRGHEVVGLSWTELTDAVSGDDLAMFDPFDTILLRNMPGGSLEQIVFRMDLVGRLAARGVRVVNAPRAMEIAVDKYLALVRMRDAGLRVPRTIVCQELDSAVEAFDELGGDVVVKPLFGSEGKNIERVRDVTEMRSLARMLIESDRVIYLQQFIDHGGEDLRLFVLGGQVIAAMRRIGADWRCNIAQGGRGEPWQSDRDVEQLAVRAAEACGTEISGVDIVRDRDENDYMLEINAVPGWQALQRVTGIDVAGRIVEYLEPPHERPMGAAGVRRGGAVTQSG